MPRVHTQKAGKDYPKDGIKKGDTYYSWSFYRGPQLRSKTPPRQSQLTAQEALSQAYCAAEALEDALAAPSMDRTVLPLSPEDIAQALRDCSEAMDEAIDTVNDQISNLQDAFQGGCPALEEKEEQLSNFEQFKQDCDGAADEIEGLEDFEKYDDFNETKQEEMRDEAMGLAQDVSPSF